MVDDLVVCRVKVPAGKAAGEIPAALDSAGVPFRQIGCVNWPDGFPYRPDVFFRTAHNGEELFLEFRVSEQSARAVTDTDQGPVWKDSCVEFFAAIPGGEGNPAGEAYYNFECNCIGRLLLHHGIKGDRKPAPEETVRSVRRWSSLGDRPFAEKGPLSWSLVEIIPAGAFFKDRPEGLGGMRMRANFYKCGDDLAVPHFLSWAPVRTAKPDFHVPAFFGRLVFEP